MSEAIEVMTFKLHGKSCAECIAAQPDIDEWLRVSGASSPGGLPNATTAPSSTC